MAAEKMLNLELTEENLNALKAVLNAGVSAIGAECVLAIAPVIEKLNTLSQSSKPAK